MLTWSNNDFASGWDRDYTLRDIAEGMGYDLGLDDYPIFDEEYRPRLNQAIYDHFQFRAIASETPAKFVYYLNRYMREHMPTYNVLYQKVRDENFDPLDSYVADSVGANTQATASTSDTSSDGHSESDTKSVLSRTPQVYLENAGSETYMDSLTHSYGDADETKTAQSKAEGSSAGDYASHSHGMQGGWASAFYDMMAAKFMEVDTLVFAMLEPLFMQYLSDYPG